MLSAAFEVGDGERARRGIVGGDQKTQAHVGELARSGLGRRWRIRRAYAALVIRALEFAAQRAAELMDQERARRDDAVGVDDRHQRRHVDGIRRCERQREQRRVARAVRKQLADDAGQRRRQRERPAFALIAREREHGVREAALRGIPAIDRIVVVRGEKGELLVGIVELHLHGRGESAQQRRHRPRLDPGEPERLPRLAHVEHARGPDRRRFAIEPQRDIAARLIDEPHGKRNVKRLLLGLARRRRRVLGDVERVGQRVVVVGPAHRTTGVPPGCTSA
jgi:hypothetical protein